MAIQPLVHEDFEKKSDLQLTEEAAEHLARNPPLKVMASFIDLLRDGQFPWLTEEETLMSVTLAERMKAIEPKHFRQIITSKLTGAKPKMAREWSADQQTEWILQAIQSGDTTLAETERAFDAKTLVVYMDAGRFWKLFRDRMPWAENSPEHKHVIGTLLELLLAHKILTPYLIRSAISGKVWHTHIPMQLRIEIDDALLEREREAPNMPYHAMDMFNIVGPKDLVEHIPLAELKGIMDVAEVAMGFAPPKEERKSLPSEVRPPPPIVVVAPKPEAPAAAEPVAAADATVTDLDESDPDVAAALRGESDEAASAPSGDVQKSDGNKEPDGDATQAFRSSDLPRLASTVADGAFSAAIESSSPSSRRGADMERSSTGGLSASVIARIIPLLEEIAKEGFKFDEGVNLSAGTIETLHALLVKKEWPKEASIHHLRSAQIAFLRSRNPDGPSEAELKAKKDPDLESKFYLDLSKTHQDLVRMLRASARDLKKSPPLKLNLGGK